MERKSRERTLLTALVLSAPGAVVTGIAAALGGASTQWSDFLRRGAELVATFVSWWVFRRIGLETTMAAGAREGLERKASRVVSMAMVCAGAAMCAVGVYKLFVYSPSGNVIMGLVIAALGVLMNGFFFLRYRSMNRKAHDPIIAAQQALYRAKLSVDLVVTLALLAVALWPAHPAVRYVDTLGAVAVSGYVMWQGARGLRRKEGNA